MPLTIRCPGCGSNLSAPDHLAGQAVRCTKCRQPMQLPAVVDAVPVAPARPVPATPIAPPARPAMERATFVQDDPDDRPRRPKARSKPRRRSRLPLVLLAAGGGLALLLIGAGVLFVVLGSGPALPGDVLGGVLADKWTRETIPGTDCSVEIPGKTDRATLTVGNKDWTGRNAMVFGETAGGRVVFMASAIDSTEAGGRPAHVFPSGWDMTELAALTAQAPGNRLIRRYEIQGRKAALMFVRDKDADSVVLHVTDGGRQFTFQAAGKGIDENDPDVRRFVESVRFASAASAPATYPGGISLPDIGWQRMSVPGSTLTVEMPNPRRPAEEPNRLRGLSDGPAGAIRFLAEVAQDQPIVFDPGGRPLRLYQVQGRDAALRTARGADGRTVLLQLYVRLGGGKMVVLEAAGIGISETTPEVKRFLDSPRFTP